MINLITVDCPHCGAELQIDSTCKEAYCTYCGKKMLLINENEHTYRVINEAEIQKVKAYKDIRNRELALEEHKLKKEDLKLKHKVRNKIIVVAIMVMLLIIFYNLMEPGAADTFGWLFFIDAVFLLIIGLSLFPRF